MILANTFKGNKGKKYCNYKEALKKELDASDYNKLDDFNTWFIDFGYESIRRQLMQKDVFDEDVFNETYVKICDSLLFANLNILNYGAYFMRSYATNLTLGFVKKAKYRNQDVSEIAKHEDDADNVIGSKKDFEEFLICIQQYVKLNYSDMEYKAFMLNAFNRNSHNQIAELLNVRTYKIQRIISKIKKDLKNSLEYMYRHYITKN